MPVTCKGSVGSRGYSLYIHRGEVKDELAELDLSWLLGPRMLLLQGGKAPVKYTRYSFPLLLEMDLR